MKIALPLLFAAGLLSALGLRAQGIETPPPKPRVTIMRVHGSNTIGAELMGALLVDFLRDEGWTQVVKISGADADSYQVAGIPIGADALVAVEVEARGSTTAFTSLARGACDIGMASRRVKDAEREALTTLGDMHAPSSVRVIALDGLAVIVHRDNPVASLDRKKIGDIFAGRVREWRELGIDHPGPIRLHARDDKSGTFDTFKALVLGDTALAPTARRHEDSRALSADVASDPSAIGFVGLPFVGSARALAVADGDGAPLGPSPFSVRTEDYPLSRRLYLYCAAAPGNPLVAKFLRFVEGDAGQAIVARVGFVDQTAAPVPREALQAAVPLRGPGPAPMPRLATEYDRLVRGAERLGLNLRFRPGATGVDNKGLADVERLLRLLARPELRGRGVVLLGFADNRGASDVNFRVSEERARAVAVFLQQRGLRAVTVRGLGAENPVSSNDSADGREKNRRVEVWLSQQG